MAVLAFLLGAGTGCVRVPETRLRGTGWELRAPKDAEFEGLEVVKSPSGEVKVKVAKYKARMNPEVIDSSAKGQVEIVREYRGFAKDLLEAGANGVKPGP